VYDTSEKDEKTENQLTSISADLKEHLKEMQNFKHEKNDWKSVLKEITKENIEAYNLIEMYIYTVENKNK
jgi:hypothetical protein